MLAHSVGFLFRSPRLVCRLVCCLSVSRQISETTRHTHEISSPLKEIGVAEQEYDVRFCPGSN